MDFPIIDLMDQEGCCRKLGDLLHPAAHRAIRPGGEVGAGHDRLLFLAGVDRPLHARAPAFSRHQPRPVPPAQAALALPPL